MDYNYIRNLVITNSDFSNYLCFTNNDITTCVFSNEKILFNENTLTLDNADIYTINSENSNYLTKYTLTGFLNVPDSSIIYSNISNYASIVSDIEYQNSHNLAYNVDLSSFYLILVLLCLPILLSFLNHFFRAKGGNI